MKKITLVLFVFLVYSHVNAQSYIGFLTDNYSGVHGVISNPASIADSRYKLDLNIAGVSAFAGNDYYGVNVFDALKNGYSFEDEANKTPSSENRGLGNIDVLGPSVMFNLSKNSAIAIFTRGRLFMNFNDIDGASIDAIENDSSDDFTFNEPSINAVGHAWAEVGITYSRVLISKRRTFLKGGFSLKYLKGIASAYATGENLSIDYDADGTDLGGGETTGSISSSGFVNYARSAEYDNDDYDFESPDNASGFGLDFGLVYEWRPNYRDFRDSKNGGYLNDKNKYKLKIGLSVTDIGYVKYKNGIREGYNITASDISEDDFDNAEDIGAFLESFYMRQESAIGYQMDLPTALHFNVDWCFNPKFYLNLNTDISLMSKDRITANLISNVYSLTPRFENKWFGVYVPFSVMQDDGFRIGAGLRAGPIYLGSGSVISALGSDKSKQADVYAGLKIPFYRTGPKDRDDDGIIDKKDDCPETPGPIENNGCPWGDRDDDGTADNEDDCPDKAGPEENKGCPYKDTDGDGVLDKDDECMFEVGTIPNKGCPEAPVTPEVQKTLNNFAKTILFDSGTAIIKEESRTVLIEIVNILKEYPSSGFTVEGHTDSTGSYELNKDLSEFRANAVKAFLVKNGIDTNRLLTVGYGESRPITSNMTRAGRAKNRRVEINLID